MLLLAVLAPVPKELPDLALLDKQSKVVEATVVAEVDVLGAVLLAEIQAI